MTEADLAYAAGLVDGEGSIGAYHPRLASYTYRVRFSVAMTDEEGPRHMATLFGGNVYAQSRLTGGGKRMYVWQLTCMKAADALEQLLPYLKIKRTKALLAIQLARRMQGPGCNTRKPISTEESSMRASIANDLRNLNFLSNRSVRCFMERSL